MLSGGVGSRDEGFRNVVGVIVVVENAAVVEENVDVPRQAVTHLYGGSSLQFLRIPEIISIQIPEGNLEPEKPMRRDE